MSKRFKLQLPTASQISIVLLLMILGSCQGIGSSTKESKASNPTIITKTLQPQPIRIQELFCACFSSRASLFFFLLLLKLDNRLR